MEEVRMEDILLLEAIERYMSGEMSAHERAMFEELRKNNPEIDQLAVEQVYFANELDKYKAVKEYKHSLHEIESKLAEEGIIAKPVLKGREKVVYLWKKYKRNIAVAASIAALISISTSGILVNYTTKQGNESYRELVYKINQTNKEVNKLKQTTTAQTGVPVKAEPVIEYDYRATGFLIDGKGYIVTNAHVISKMKNIYVENKKGEYYRAVSIYSDSNADLAVLKIIDTAYKTITNLPYSIKKGNADMGEQFFTLGFPRNEIVYGEGYLSAKSGNEGDSTAYQLTVSANPGNSGAPVINRNGEIIAIITGKDTKADGVVYAAKSNNIYKLLESIKKSSADSSTKTIKTPSNSGLKGLERTQQVKKMEEFVFMVVGN